MIDASQAPLIDSSHKSTFTEVAVVLIALPVFLVLQLLLSDSDYLLSRHLWLDEVLTHKIVTENDPSHFVRHLWEAEPNPPALHIMLRVVCTLVRDNSEFTFRSVTLFAVMLGLVGLYLTLRRAFGVLVSLVGTLAVWCHPLLLTAAFDARFYGPLFAAAVWFALLLGRTKDVSRGVILPCCLAVLSALLCMIHYFGIGSFVLACMAEAVLNRNRFYRKPRVLLALSVGPLLLGSWMTLFLLQQRALMPLSWIADPSLNQVATFGVAILLPPSLGGVVLAAWLSTFLPPKGDSFSPSSNQVQALAGVTSQALMVPILIVFTYLIQPALVARYAIVAVAVLGPAVAFVACRMNRTCLVGSCLFFALYSSWLLRYDAVDARRQDDKMDRLIATVRKSVKDDYVLITSTHVLIPLIHHAPDLRGRCVYFDREVYVTRAERFDPYVALGHHRQFGGTQVLRWDDVAPLGRVYWLGSQSGLELLHDRVPSGMTTTPIEGGLYRLEWSAGRTEDATGQ